MIIFLRFENKHQSRNVINNVKIEGLTYVKTNDILNKLCNFNENLYISDETIVADNRLSIGFGSSISIIDYVFHNRLSPGRYTCTS